MQQLHSYTDTRVCAVCGFAGGRTPWRWYAYCPGVRWYAWERIPKNLATRIALNREGLKPADLAQPDGYYVAWSRRTYVLLYDRERAILKRAARSEREQAARAESGRRLTALRTCTTCGSVVKSPKHLVPVGDGSEETHRLCSACFGEWEHQQEIRGLCVHVQELLTAATKDGARPLRVLDTETTGLDSEDEPIELAILDGLSGTVLLDTRLRPSVPITDGAYMVHGITEEELHEVPTLPDLWPRVCQLLAGTLVIAYNAEFDALMLGQGAARYGLEMPRARWWCLMEACSALNPDVDEHGDRRWLSLAAAYYALGIQAPWAPHGALADAQAACIVLHELASRATDVPKTGDVAQ
jgi:DNA polymerase III epsilon subunit-like protein